MAGTLNHGAGRGDANWRAKAAVIEGYLIDHQPPRRTITALSKAGVHFQGGEEVQVMQFENDYDKEVYNGDVGYIDDVAPRLGFHPRLYRKGALMTTMKHAALAAGFATLAGIAAGLPSSKIARRHRHASKRRH
jgi:hypothetical protein